MLQSNCLRLNAETMNGNGAVLIICIRPVFGTTIQSNTNTLFGPLFGPYGIRIEYPVHPKFQLNSHNYYS